MPASTLADNGKSSMRKQNPQRGLVASCPTAGLSKLPWRRSRQDEYQRTLVLGLSSHFQVFSVRKLALRALVARYLSNTQRRPDKEVVVCMGG